MKEGTIIKLKSSILQSSDTTGLLMVITGEDAELGDEFYSARPIGDGWDEIDLNIPQYLVYTEMIDHTHKHKEDEP